MANGNDKDRKVDVFAKPESLADKLRKRRKALEEGDPSGGGAFQPTSDKKKKKNGY